MSPLPIVEDFNWLEFLRAECKRTSQTQVAARLNVSQSMLNQVLQGKYKASTSNIEARVRGEYHHETVRCPVFHDISRRDCLDNQQRPLNPNNSLRLGCYWACRGGCPHSSLPNTRHLPTNHGAHS